MVENSFMILITNTVTSSQKDIQKKLYIVVQVVSFAWYIHIEQMNVPGRFSLKVRVYSDWLMVPAVVSRR